MSPRLIERRQHPRAHPPGGTILSFSAHQPEGTEGDGLLVELSQQGCRIESEQPLHPAHAYRLIIPRTMHTQPIIVAHAIIRWAVVPCYGLKFLSLTVEAEAALKEYLRQLGQVPAS